MLQPERHQVNHTVRQLDTHHDLILAIRDEPRHPISPTPAGDKQPTP
ncbi:hypothetical protein ACFQ3B_20345 [Stackebrandtia endophytica]|nr:hypothetical protein [Stackebrandtia endophytica]